MSETREETPHSGEAEAPRDGETPRDEATPRNEEPSQSGELQSEEELDRLIDKELEDVGKDEENETKPRGNIDERQRAIDEELRKLREELEMDSGSPDEMSQEYDIGARVKQLNEELAKEGPIEEKKNRKVNFPENIVSMAVPPPEYPEDEVAAANEEAARLEESGAGDESSDPPGGSERDGQVMPSGRDEGQGAVEVSGGTADGAQTALSAGEESGTTQREVASASADTAPSTPSPADTAPPSTPSPANTAPSTPSPADRLPNSTDETDSAMSSEQRQQESEQQRPVYQEQTVARSDTEEGSPRTDHQAEVSTKNASETSDPNDLEVERLTLRPQEENRTFKSQSRGQDPSSGQGSGSSGLKEVSEDEHILIERGGKFFYVSVQDLSREERENLGVTLKSDSVKKDSQLPLLQPSPPQRARPATATGGKNSIGSRRPLPPRAMSAKTSQEYDRQARANATYEEPFGNPRSQYGMTPEQKQHRRDQARLRAEKAREEKEREEREKREKEEMCEGVFRAWVEQKRNESTQRKKEERERRKAENENKEVRSPQEAFDAWLQHKKTQKKTETKVKERMSEEEKDAYFMRSREECERAFKDWVRSKNANLRQTHSMSRAGALESKRRAQHSRKSRNLAKALEVAQSYRYNDYYGYRF